MEKRQAFRAARASGDARALWRLREDVAPAQLVLSTDDEVVWRAAAAATAERARIPPPTFAPAEGTDVFAVSAARWHRHSAQSPNGEGMWDVLFAQRRSDVPWASLCDGQLVNHFRRSGLLTTKAALGTSLEALRWALDEPVLYALAARFRAAGADGIYLVSRFGPPDTILGAEEIFTVVSPYGKCVLLSGPR